MSVITSLLEQQSWTEPLSEFNQNISWQFGKQHPSSPPQFSLSYLCSSLLRYRFSRAQQYSFSKSTTVTELNFYSKYRKINTEQRSVLTSVSYTYAGQLGFGKVIEKSELYATSSFPFLISKLFCAQLYQPQGCFCLYPEYCYLLQLFLCSASCLLGRESKQEIECVIGSWSQYCSQPHRHNLDVWG